MSESIVHNWLPITIYNGGKIGPKRTMFFTDQFSSSRYRPRWTIENENRLAQEEYERRNPPTPPTPIFRNVMGRVAVAAQAAQFE